MNVEAIVLVHVLVGMIFRFVGTPSGVSQGPFMGLLLGYSPLEVVSCMGERPW